MFSPNTPLAFLFSFFTVSVVLAGPPMPMPMPKNQVVSQEGCVVLHPESLPWKQPKMASWTGSCVSGKAQGYGWYKFDLTNDGYPASSVEIFLELGDGSLTNDFYFAKMMTGSELNYEGYAQAGGYQVNSGNCLALAECYRTMQALKEKATSPKPPMPPVAPAEPEETVDSEESEQIEEALPETPLEIAQRELKEVMYNQVRSFVRERFQDQPNMNTTVFVSIMSFEYYFREYAENICHRNGRVLQNCQLYQYRIATDALKNLAEGQSDESALLKLRRPYSSFEESVCARRSSMQDLFSCIHTAIKNKEKNISAKHPRAMASGATAIAAYSEALSLMEAEGGSAKTSAYLGSYERLLEFIYEQSITPWVD